MTSIIIYLLEASATMAFFYLMYILVLRNETFFNINRFFLLAIVTFSFLFPLLSIDIRPAQMVVVQQPIEEITKMRLSYYNAMDIWMYDIHQATNGSENASQKTLVFSTSTSWSSLVFTMFLVIYVIGIVVCLSRTFWTMRWIRKMIKSYPNEKINGVQVIKLPNPIAPFSFMKNVFVQESMINTPEFDQILAHERTHIQEKHSLDLIIVQLLAAFLWFNPVIWQLIKSLKTTHEYIADKKMINTGYSLVEYQTLLLRQLISNNSYGLVHNFNLTFIKKRITMMKNKKSGWTGRAKVAVVLSAAVLFSLVIVQCNSAIEEQDAIESVQSTIDDFTEGVDLPVLPQSEYHLTDEEADILNVTISGNKLYINGKACEVNEIAAIIKDLDFKGHPLVVMRINRNQDMTLVGDVQWELRKTNQRKLLYIGRTEEGEKVEMAFLLPPVPGDLSAGIILPTIDDAYIAETGIKILKIDLANNDGVINQRRVYDFVQEQMKQQSDNYVVSAKINDQGTYDSYLKNLSFIQEGFNQIYDERAQKMFGKSYFDFNKDIPEEKAQYDAVRKGIPRAISVAERHQDLGK